MLFSCEAPKMLCGLRNFETIANHTKALRSEMHLPPSVIVVRSLHILYYGGLQHCESCVSIVCLLWTDMP